jgi:hypothetical protein
MNALKNKHTIIAVIMAPVLAIVTYFGIGWLFGEKPQMAQEGQSYPMVEKPNCRYQSGRCGLKNADFELELTVSQRSEDGLELHLESAHALDGVMIALARGGEDKPRPHAMRQADSEGMVWTTDVRVPDIEADRLQLVAAVGHMYWFGDVSTKFTAH